MRPRFAGRPGGKKDPHHMHDVLIKNLSLHCLALDASLQWVSNDICSSLPIIFTAWKLLMSVTFGVRTPKAPVGEFPALCKPHRRNYGEELRPAAQSYPEISESSPCGQRGDAWHPKETITKVHTSSCIHGNAKPMVAWTHEGILADLERSRARTSLGLFINLHHVSEPKVRDLH